jgi:hypothetical protein
MSSTTPSLADARDTLRAQETAGALSAAHAKEMLGQGLDRFERLCGKDLAAMTPDDVEPCLDAIARKWSRHFASKRAFDNFRSRVRRAVRQARGDEAPRITPGSWPPAWREIYDHVGARTKRGAFLPALTRLGNRAVADGLAPSEVTSRWLAEQLARTKGSERTSLRSSVKGWNRARGELDLPLAALELPAAQAPRSSLLPWSAFPATLEAEVDAFVAWVANRTDSKTDLADLTDEELDALGDDHRIFQSNGREVAPDRPRRQRYLEEVKKYLLALANGVAFKGRNSADIRHLRQLVRLDGINGYAAYYKNRKGVDRSRYLQCLAGVAIMGARYHGEPERIIELLKRKRHDLAPDDANVMSESRQAAVNALLSEPEAIIRFYGAPEAIWRRGIALIERGRIFDGIAHCETAIFLRMAQSLPMRRRNSLGLRVSGQHPTLHLPTNARRCREVSVRIPRQEVKNWKPIVATIPDPVLAKWLFEYVWSKKPSLAGRSMRDWMVDYYYQPGSRCDYLFPGAAKAELPPEWADLGEGYFRSTKQFADRTARLTRELVGVELTPHVLRHVLAMVVLRLKPELKLILGDLLGDELATIENFYTVDRTSAAVSTVLDLLNRGSPDPIKVLEKIKKRLEDV